jgi:hypothetical protein
MQIGASNGIALNTVIGTVTVQDELVAGAYLDAHADFVLDAATYFQFANQDASNFRITRVANAAAPEPTDGPRVHLITVFYTTSNFRITRVANAAAPEPTDGPRVHLITVFYTKA